MDDLIQSSVFFSLTNLCFLYQRWKYDTKKRRSIGSGPSIESKVDAENPELGPYDFDVLIVGAGPAGSTAAYFSVNEGNLKVGLVDKKAFPRHKPCGDAWCAPALKILDEMGVLEKMEKDGIINSVNRGGFISPFGYQCINTDGAEYGAVTGCKTYAIKRYIADKYLVEAATSSPLCTLVESEVYDAEFCEGRNGTGYWKVHTSTAGEDGTIEHCYTAKMLLICDGSTSYLGQKLGLVKKGSVSEAVCSHAYVKGGTHRWANADGVMVFNRSVLPGYSALFRHYNDDMYLGTYILPGGRATSRCIAPVELELVQHHPYIQQAFGDRYEFAEKRIVAPIRLGGVLKSYGRQVLLVGDAAGQVRLVLALEVVVVAVLLVVVLQVAIVVIVVVAVAVV